MSELRKLTRLGGDVRKIAALLQSKGRGRDTILAHITPKEAALLKARGGRGSTNPETGLLEFQPEDEFGIGEPTGAGDQAATAAPSYGEEFYPQSYGEEFYPQPATPVGATPAAAGTTPAPEPIVPQPATPSFRPSQMYGEGMTGEATRLYDIGAAAPAPAPAAAPGLAQRAAAATGLSEKAIERLGLAGLQAIPGTMQARRAAREGQAAKAEMQAMAAPYRSQGQQLQALAQAGQLAPVAQQRIEAARAQLAQGAQARGGVGAAQVATQIEALRQQLLQQQADYGLKLSNIGDQIALGAIRTGLQADQYVQQLTSNFYNNLFRTLGGYEPQPLRNP